MDDRTHRAAHRIEGGPPPRNRAGTARALGCRQSMMPVNAGLRQRSVRPCVDALAASQADLSRARATKRATTKRKPFSLSRLRCSKTIASLRRRWRGSMPATAANQAWSAAIDPEIASYDAAERSLFPRARIRFARSPGSRAATSGQVKPIRSCRPALSSRPTTCRLPRFWPPIGVMAGWYCAGEARSSHVAILARSRGVPMIVGVDVDHLEDGARRSARCGRGASDCRSRRRYASQLLISAAPSSRRLGRQLASFSGPALTADR